MKRTKRLQGYRHTSDFKQAAHATVIFDDQAQTVWEVLENRSRAGEVAKEKGFQALDVMAHVARINEEGKKIVEENQADDDPRNRYDFLKEEFTGRYHFGLCNSLLKWDPHYHIIGVTSPDMEPAKDSDPYVYRFFRSLPRYDLHDLDSFEAVYGLYRYLLSHVGLHEERNFQTVVGYGGLSNSTYEEHEPEPRVMDKIEEKVAKVADRGLEEIEEEPERAGPGEEELGECPAEECEGVLINIFRIPDYLEQADPPPNIRKRLLTAYEWRTGKAHPPPGLRNPRTREEAREAFEAML
jgi:hypothetical protein